MSLYGQVHTRNNRYRLKGDFHHCTLGIPIRNADEGWRLMGITNPRDMTYIHAYGGEAVFFESLGQGKLLASRCDNQDCESGGYSYLPFRIHCPDCLQKNIIVDVTSVAVNTAKIHTFMVCERSGAFSLLDKPIKFINIEFQGIETILMSYMVAGKPETGMSVVPVFRTVNPTYTILDLAWVPAGTGAKDLPSGFTFSS